jgi:hypothetical protein
MYDLPQPIGGRTVKKIKNFQVKDARGRDVFLAPEKPFMLDEAFLIAIDQAKGTGVKLLKASSKIVAAQSVKAPEIVLEDAELDAVRKAVKACHAFTDILAEQIDEAIDKASEAIVEVK